MFTTSRSDLLVPNPAPRPQELWCVTSFYNPVGFGRLAKNYEIFAKRLKSQGGKLLTVEMKDVDGKFWLDDRLADKHIKVEDGDIMFQKEKLLNYGATLLPDSCDALCWIDCDMLYESEIWLEQIKDELAKFQTTQAFRRFARMPARSLKFDVGCCLPNSVKDCFVKQIQENQSIKRSYGYPAPGGAWAARRDFFEAIGGLYQYDVIGGGDVVYAGAVLGVDISKRYTLAGTKEMSDYVKKIGSLVKGGVGYIESDACHLWHGDDTNRQYTTRYIEFRKMGYEPSIHLDESGPAFKWSAATTEEMKSYVRNYFIARKEDG